MTTSTAELSRRAARPPDHAAEHQVLTSLIRESARSPDTVLQALAEAALRLCAAHSAGISVLEEADGQPVFRWRAISGQWADQLGAIMPRDASPSGTALDRNAALLLSRPDQQYPHLGGTRPPIEEALLVPFSVDGSPVGSLWVMAHDTTRAFDAEDLRVLTMLGDIAAGAHRARSVSASARDDADPLRRARALAAGQKKALELAVSGAPLPAVLQVLAETARAQFHSGAMAAIFVMDPDGVHLRFGAGAGVAPAFAQLIDGASIGPLSPSCGQAADTGAAVVVADVLRDPLWGPHLTAARTHGIRACWSFPIATFSGHVLGTLTLYHTRPREPVPHDREAVRVLTHTASLVLERHRVTAERNRAEQQVRALADDLRRRLDDQETLLRVVPVGVFITQDPTCAQIAVNAAGAAMLRIPEGVNVSKSAPGAADRLPFRVFRHGTEVPADELPMQRAARQGDIIAGEECDIVFADGSSMTLLEHASPLFDEAGQVRGCVGVFVDITARKQAEQALRLSEEQLQQADRRKNHFLATLAHELRNPLAPVRTGLQFIRLAGDTPGAVEQVRATMERQIAHMVRLIDDLLDISRITSGTIQLQRTLVPLSDLVESAVDANQAILAEAGVQLAVHLPAEPCALDVDATRFVQILSNLLHNAAKFTPSNGRIEVAAERREGSGSASDELVLTVSDTGVGIASDLLPHVFDLFAQGERLALQSHGGMGIGLSLARQLVEMHGGSIEATSAGPGCGSTFTLRLPIADAPASSDTSVAPSAGETTTRRRVLVIDDNADAAQMLAMLIRAMGGEARTATNGASGIRLARAFRPDLILLDIGMPGIDGYETCRRIRQESFGRSVCIVALTGWGQEKDKQQAGEAGFDLHLTKPADPLVLEHLLAGDPHADARHTVRLSRERS